jgi:hypothetical protein
MLVAVMLATVVMIADTVVAQASSGGAAGNSANYSLAQNRFELNSGYILTLQFRGTPVTNVVQWHVVKTPSGVVSANINRVNGQNVFSFTGLAPAPEHTFNIIAVVMEGNTEVATIHLTVSIHTA